MENSELSRWRSEVIERFINIEIMIDTIICQHYFKRVIKPFLFDVLRDPNFTFGLKRKILGKIIGEENSTEIQDLNKLNKIRNRFAHCGLEFISTGKPEESFIHDPEKPGTPLDFRKQYDDFLKTAPSVEMYLFNLFKGKGGEIFSKPD